MAVLVTSGVSTTTLLWCLLYTWLVVCNRLVRTQFIFREDPLGMRPSTYLLLLSSGWPDGRTGPPTIRNLFLLLSFVWRHKVLLFLFDIQRPDTNSFRRRPVPATRGYIGQQALLFASLFPSPTRLKFSGWMSWPTFLTVGQSLDIPEFVLFFSLFFLSTFFFFLWRRERGFLLLC